MNITPNTAVKETTPVETIRPLSAPAQTDTAESRDSQKAAKKTKADKNQPLSAKDTKALTDHMNDIMDDLQTSLGFSIREELNHQVVVEITDRKTNELVKQIPSEELLKIKEKMEELTGLIFDQSV